MAKLLHCKKCGSQNHVKAGFVKGKERYKCKDWGCQFVPTKQRGKSVTKICQQRNGPGGIRTPDIGLEARRYILAKPQILFYSCIDTYFFSTYKNESKERLSVRFQ